LPRSKKRSAAKPLSTQPDLVFFIDECLGTRRVSDALMRTGATVVVHQAHFSNRQGIQDAEWLLEIGQRGWVVLTKDKNFKRRPLEREAILAGGIRAFFLSATNLSTEQVATTFVEALPRIRRLCQRHSGPLRVSPVSPKLTSWSLPDASARSV
jgi:predicted nuclease of predicted toxin-antitoxin system